MTPYLPPANVDFALLATAWLRARGRYGQALEEAKALGSERVYEILKASASVLDSSQVPGMGAVSSGFLASLVGTSAFDVIAQQARKAPLDSQFMSVSAAAEGALATEGEPKVFSTLTTLSTTLPSLKVCSLVAISAEALKGAPSLVSGLVSAELRSAVARASDAVFLSVLGDASPAQSHASAGSSVANVAADVGTLLGDILTDGSRPFILVSIKTAAHLATKVASGLVSFTDIALPGGGSLLGVPLVIANGMSDSSVIAVDAARLVVNTGSVSVDSSQQASINLSDNPSSPSDLVSLWQSNLSAVRCERIFGIAIPDPTSVSTLTSVSW